ncbi:MAG: hypothetical protein ABW000_15425 [Actinoplanes sp.]
MRTMIAPARHPAVTPPSAAGRALVVALAGGFLGAGAANRLGRQAVPPPGAEAAEIRSSSAVPRWRSLTMPTG